MNDRVGPPIPQAAKALGKRCSSPRSPNHRSCLCGSNPQISFTHEEPNRCPSSIDKQESDKYFRDHDGRTRTERNNGDTVIASDPVSGVTPEIRTASKIAFKTMMRYSGPVHRCDGCGASRRNIEQRGGEELHLLSPGGGRPDNPHGRPGTQIVNGIPAKSARSTITIRAGQIGDDREIKIVSERWFSNDLHMLSKSSNKDPRFGETTCEITNILRGA
jgi:hypothetical protein